MYDSVLMSESNFIRVTENHQESMRSVMCMDRTFNLTGPGSSIEERRSAEKKVTGSNLGADNQSRLQKRDNTMFQKHLFEKQNL